MKMGTIASPWHYDVARERPLSFSGTFPSMRARYAKTGDLARLFRFKVFEPDPTPCAQAVPCLFDAA